MLSSIRNAKFIIKMWLFTMLITAVCVLSLDKFSFGISKRSFFFCVYLMQFAPILSKLLSIRRKINQESLVVQVVYTDEVNFHLKVGTHEGTNPASLSLSQVLETCPLVCTTHFSEISQKPNQNTEQQNQMHSLS